MGWFFGRGSRPHPHARELRGLRCCIVAQRRAVIELWHRQGAASREALTERLSQLNCYNHGAGGSDPFTEHVLQVPVGDLDPPLLLGAEWRGETAASIAWTLGLMEEIPPTSLRSDAAKLEALFPLRGPPPPSIRPARLRERALIASTLAEWRQQLNAATARRATAAGEAAPETAALEFSRAYERTRGLLWVLSDAPSIDDTPLEA